MNTDSHPRARAYEPVHQNLPEREPAFPLSPEECREFHTRGFVIVPGRFSQEDVELWRAEAERLCEESVGTDENNMRYAMGNRPDEATWPWKIDPFFDLLPVFGRLVRDRRICDAVSSLFGGYPARLFKDKLIIKPAGSGRNSLHQDYNWWQGFPSSLLSVVIPIDEMTRENGCTQVYTGWERGFLHEPGTQDGNLDEALLGEEERVYLELKPGDIAIFNCFVPHRADRNESDGPRRAMFLTYNDARDGEFYQAHYDHFFAYLCSKLTPEEREKKYWA